MVVDFICCEAPADPFVGGPFFQAFSPEFFDEIPKFRRFSWEVRIELVARCDDSAIFDDWHKVLLKQRASERDVAPQIRGENHNPVGCEVVAVDDSAVLCVDETADSVRIFYCARNASDGDFVYEFRNECAGCGGPPLLGNQQLFRPAIRGTQPIFEIRPLGECLNQELVAVPGGEEKSDGSAGP